MIERMVLFGASGDLTSRLLLPAVAQLAEAELLPPGLTIVGSDITDWSVDDFRQHIAGKLEEHATVTPATRDAVVRMLSFQPGDVTRSEDVSRVIGDDHPDTLVYLALPPSLLTKVLLALATTTLGAADAVSGANNVPGLWIGDRGEGAQYLARCVLTETQPRRVGRLHRRSVG
jgi:glucose-6-phosphate 1-dehydrogenase